MHCRWLWASIIWPRFVQFPVTLNNFEGHSPVAGLFECTSTNIYATFHTISTDTTRRSFPRRQLSFLSRLLLYLTVSCVWTVGFRPRAHYAQLVKLDDVHVKFIWSVAYCRVAYNRKKRLVCVRLSVHMSIPSICSEWLTWVSTGMRPAYVLVSLSEGWYTYPVQLSQTMSSIRTSVHVKFISSVHRASKLPS